MKRESQSESIEIVPLLNAKSLIDYNIIISSQFII